MCYYFDDIGKIKDFDFDILLHKKSYQKYFGLWRFMQVFDWCKTLHIGFDKVNGFIRLYDGNRYLVLFSPEKNMMPFMIGLETL